MQAFRIADKRFSIFDGTGARLVGGRWNSPGKPVIYAAETFSGALLEILVNSNLGRVPKTHAVVEVAIADTVVIESLMSHKLADWDTQDQIASRAFGDQWLAEKRSAVLLVPSAITGGRERNVLINPEHVDFAEITAGKPQDVQWDKRLLRASGLGLTTHG